jgi:hypothetical protein
MRVEPSPDKRKPGSQLPGAITALVTDPEFISRGESLSEVMLDAAQDDGILKDLPVIGTLFSIGRLASSISDWMFLNKMSRFACQLATVPEKEFRAFREKINADPKFRDRVGKNVLLLIERADDIEKPPLLGRAFAALIEGKVTEEQFRRMAAGINVALMDDINRLIEIKHTNFSSSWASGLMSAGLARIAVSAAMGSNATFFIITETGKLVLEHCLARSADSEG